MAGEWRTVRLGDLTTWSSGGTPSKANPEFWNGDIPWISASSMKTTLLCDSDLKLTKAGLKNGSRLAETNSILLLVRGSELHKRIPVGVATRPVAFNQDVKALKVRGEMLSDYLFYWLLGNKTMLLGKVEQTGIGAGKLDTEVLKNLFVQLPPLSEQKRIASILGALDDKIELNRKMNATLEAMARALFQSWFVDFDPVRRNIDRKANSSSQRPSSKTDSAAQAFSDASFSAYDHLFPDEFQDSELGHIPKGWEAGVVANVFNLIMGQSPPGDTYNNEGKGLPFYQGRTDFGFRYPSRRIFCSSPTRYANTGDTLVSVRAPVGDINMAYEECCIGRGVAAVRHMSGGTSFTYYSMANLYPDFAAYEAEGTVFGSISKQNFENLRCVIPPPNIVSVYETLAGPLDEQIRSLELQSCTLTALRDTLLPKLLSGVLKVTTE